MRRDARASLYAAASMARVAVAAPLLSLLLAALAVLADPALVGRAVSLDWQVGDLRPLLRALQACFSLLCALVLLRRTTVQSLARRAVAARRELLAGLGLALASLALGVGTLEIGLRLAGRPFGNAREPSEYRLAQFDPELGWSYRPGLSASQRVGSVDRRAVYHFDAEGLRVPSPEHRRDPLRRELLLVGDSFAMGHGVAYADSLAGRLAAQPALPYDVVNLGVQGFGTDQAMLQLERHLPHHDAAVVVYVFLCDHVARNASGDRRLLRPARRFLGTKPLFALAPDGSLEQLREPLPYSELGYSRLAASLAILWTGYGPVPSLELTRALVSRMRNASEERGARFMVVHWARRQTERSCGLAPFASMPGLQVIDTRDGAPDDFARWTIPGDGHPDERAHAWVAERVREELLR